MPDVGARHVRLAGEADVAGFRQAARRLLGGGVEPSQVSWQVSSGGADDLFAAEPDAGEVDAVAAPVRVPPFFVPLCERAALHRDPGRFGLLYRLLWRLVHDPGLRNDALDPDRVAAESLARVVRREMHKMTAFVRFRPIDAGEGQTSGEGTAASPVEDIDSDIDFDPDFDVSVTGNPSVTGPVSDLAQQPVGPHAPEANASARWHVAWFEPDHHIVEATAPFFARRFAQMRWAILTPERSVRWDGSTLAFGPGAQRSEAPPADAGEQLWLTYYAHIFNPARLKLQAMKKEMPRRYWPNLPEAALIQPLTDLAGARSHAMVEQGGSEPVRRRPSASLALRIDAEPSAGAATVSAVDTLAALREATQRCRDCPIGEHATQAVPGIGNKSARLMLVGEQPGDKEDLRGEPFVGPAGQLLDKALRELGWPRDAVYLTNAVKHFKYEMRGARRIHKTPAQREAAACLQWLEREIELVRPEALVALGATAARALLGRAVGVTRERGQWLPRADGVPVLITLHPSALLRMEPALQAEAFEAWKSDLRLAASHIDPPSPSG